MRIQFIAISIAKKVCGHLHISVLTKPHLSYTNDETILYIIHPTVENHVVLVGANAENISALSKQAPFARRVFRRRSKTQGYGSQHVYIAFQAGNE